MPNIYFRCTARAILAAGVLLSALTGCSIQQTPLDKHGLTPMTPQNTPMTRASVPMRPIGSFLALDGKTQTLPYSPMPWEFGCLPCVNSASGDMVMLDTGMDVSAHVTLDIIRDGKYPVQLSRHPSVSYIPSLSLGGIAAERFLADVDDKEWQFSIFGLPIYGARAWTLGTQLLSHSKYLAFDNRNHCVTIGLEDFHGTNNLRWTWYDMYTYEHRPWVNLPVAGGKSMSFLADSAGGPHLILDREQWDDIAPHVQVARQMADQYPTWYGMQPVDVYVVRELSFGPLHLRNEAVWVRKGDDSGEEPSFGLGIFAGTVAVWDFHNHRFGVGA